jgi:acetyltransferase-like isoleucine patch superfamily enzyme
MKATSSPTQTYEPSALWRKFLVRPFHEKRRYVFDLLRWLWRFYYFDTRHPVLLGQGVHIEKRHGRITTGGVCVIRPGCRMGVVGRGKEPAHLHIGVGSEIGSRTIINVAERVEIGDRCSISWDCDISDSDFHQIVMGDGSRPLVTESVIIEDDVWVGSHVLIFKGVRIGHNSVIAAGSVVRRDVPPNSLMAGNPARRIAEIQGWER